ncbi:hypothetical protein GGF32_008216 [Allomyces javanicus]|nr:hypothetical protein GGF32_008216 [Allomyces javanicus]
MSRTASSSSITTMRIISAALFLVMAVAMLPAAMCAAADTDANASADADVSSAMLVRREIDWANSKPYDGSVWDGTRWITPESGRARGLLKIGIDWANSKPYDGSAWDGTRWVASHSHRNRGSLERSGSRDSRGGVKGHDTENETHEIQHGSGEHGRGHGGSNGWGHGRVRAKGHGRYGRGGKHKTSHSTYGTHGTYGATMTYPGTIIVTILTELNVTSTAAPSAGSGTASTETDTDTQSTATGTGTQSTATGTGTQSAGTGTGTETTATECHAARDTTMAPSRWQQHPHKRMIRRC